MKEKIGKILMFGSIIGLILMIVFGVRIINEYNKKYDTWLYLSVKSSTLTLKSHYFDKYVKSIETLPYKGEYDAIRRKIEHKSFDHNFLLMKEYQRRLHDIKDLDIKSTEYQLAINEINNNTNLEFSGAFYL